MPQPDGPGSLFTWKVAMRPMIGRTIMAAALGAAVLGLALTTGTAAEASTTPLLGVITGTPQTFESATGLVPNINTCYLVWGNPISGHCRIISGSQLLVEIGEPGQGDVPSLPDIAAGDADSWLDSLASSLEALPLQAAVSFDAEANQAYPAVVPSQYIAAFDHVASIMHSYDLLSFYQVAQDQSYTVPVSTLWPGAAYVDYTAIDGYYGQVASADDWTYQTVFGNTIDELQALSSDPTEITEAGVPADVPSSDGTQASLITQMLAGAQAQPGVAGIMYFDQYTWDIDANSQALANYQAGIAGW
jgi:hypothetical protein